MASSTEVLSKITEDEYSSRIFCQISTEFGTLGTSTVRDAWSANILYSGCFAKYDAYVVARSVRIGI